MASLDTLSAFGSELVADQFASAQGGILPPWWICWFYPEYCYPFYL